MSFIPKPQEIYKHFKGNLYQITAVAQHTETGEQLVVYQALYGDFKTYARPLAMFTERLDRNKYPDASQEFRFQLQGPEARRQKAEMDADSAAPAESKSTEPTEGNSAETAGGKNAGAAAESKSTGTAAGEKCSEPAGGKNAETAADEKSAEGEFVPDPLVLEFLDADEYGQKLNILAALHHRITNDMITTMAVSCDLEINDGDVEERYESLKTCLITRERYECNRIR